MGLPGGRGPIGPRVWSTFTFTLINTWHKRKRKVPSFLCVWSLIPGLDWLQRREGSWPFKLLSVKSIFRCADRDVFRCLWHDVTLIHLLSRVLEATAVRAGQKATRWGSLSAVAQQFMLCTYLHCISSALLSPQGAMGFPGMLGQKVRQ